jgi:SAM-dependent methyltransferase
VGWVYAVDIAQKRLDAILAAANGRSLGNIETVLASEDGPRLTRPVDLIFICNTYHHLSDRIDYLRALGQLLLPGGRIAIIELDRTPWYYFLAAHRTDPDLIRREMEMAGYVLSDTYDVLAYQSFQVFKTSTVTKTLPKQSSSGNFDSGARDVPGDLP